MTMTMTDPNKYCCWNFSIQAIDDVSWWQPVYKFLQFAETTRFKFSEKTIEWL